MPAHSSVPAPTSKSRISGRATAPRNAGIHRGCNRPFIPDRVVEPPSLAPVLMQSQLVEAVPPASAHDRMEVVQEPAAQSGKQEDSLPQGCVMGIPLAKGTGVTRVPHLPITLDLAIMRSIQADNYKFIRHMIMTGWSPTNPSACSFSVTINRNGEQEVWNISKATPLHYAVCSGSLQAATAILIAFPELAGLSCKVETIDSSRMPRESTWTTLDLTSFFGNLYMTLDHDRHLAYQQASLVLLHLKQDPKRLPFMEYTTPVDRLAAAGKNPLEVTQALLSAIQPLGN